MPYENSGVHWDSNSQNGSSLGSVKVHALTLFCTPGNTRCDSWASFLAHNLANPCFGREPKARVVTWVDSFSFCKVVTMLINFVATLFSPHWMPFTIPSYCPFSSFDMSKSNSIIYNLSGLLWLSIALRFKSHILVVLNLILMFCLNSD